jgi:hypothetical protein
MTPLPPPESPYTLPVAGSPLSVRTERGADRSRRGEVKLNAPRRLPLGFPLLLRNACTLGTAVCSRVLELLQATPAATEVRCGRKSRKLKP